LTWRWHGTISATSCQKKNLIHYFLSNCTAGMFLFFISYKVSKWRYFILLCCSKFQHSSIYWIENIILAHNTYLSFYFHLIFGTFIQYLKKIEVYWWFHPKFYCLFSIDVVLGQKKLCNFAPNCQKNTHYTRGQNSWPFEGLKFS